MSALGDGGRNDQVVQRAEDAAIGKLEHMGIDHRRAHVAVSEQLLNGSYVGAPLEQMGREGMPQRVHRHGFDNAA